MMLPSHHTWERATKISPIWQKEQQKAGSQQCQRVRRDRCNRFDRHDGSLQLKTALFELLTWGKGCGSPLEERQNISFISYLSQRCYQTHTLSKQRPHVQCNVGTNPINNYRFNLKLTPHGIVFFRMLKKLLNLKSSFNCNSCYNLRRACWDTALTLSSLPNE